MQTATYVDFAVLKQQVTIAQAVQMLGLKMRQNGSQWRSECPACHAGGDRALAVNTDRQSFYCFSLKAGGDVIALVAHITGKSQRDAAHQLATHFRFAGGSNDPPAQEPPAPQQRLGFDADAYLRGLDPAADPLKPLGLAPETLRDWRAGYCKSGLNRGKLAIALCDREGTIKGFAGRALDSNSLTFPNGIDARDIIFGADKVLEGEVRLLSGPLDVMQASEVGEPAVCFLTETVEPQQLEQLAALLDMKKAKLIL